MLNTTDDPSLFIDDVEINKSGEKIKEEGSPDSKQESSKRSLGRRSPDRISSKARSGDATPAA